MSAPEAAREVSSAQKKKKKKLLMILIVLAVIAAGVCVFLFARRGTESTAAEYLDSPVVRGPISRTLSGKGTLKPANQYTVTALVQGEILTADFSEGEMVEKGDVLYEINSADAQSEIAQKENALAQAELSLASSQRGLAQSQRSYGNTYGNQFARATGSGTVTGLNVSVGDELASGTIVATVRDSDTMLLKVPFPADDAVGFAVGQAAEVTLNGTFETLPGTVAEISGAERVGAGNMLTRDVKISVRNPGALTKGQTASAGIGGVYGAGSGTFEYNFERPVVTEAAGRVVALNVHDGDRVSEGQTILTLGGTLSNTVQGAAEAVQNSAGNVENAELGVESARSSLESARERLRDYTILSPITGTVVEKRRKAGDNLSSNDSGDSRVLCVIYDLSYLEMTINVDELDINSLQVGNKVLVTASAAPGNEYEGIVTRKGLNGTTQNGVTTYPVTVRLDETDGLLPGMNADARIVVESDDDALMIPSTAVDRGDIVLVSKNSPSAVNALNKPSPYPEAVYVPVVTGISDSFYVQILSGLQEGDVVYTSDTDLGLGDFDFAMSGMEDMNLSDEYE